MLRSLEDRSAKQHGQRDVVAVVALSREEEDTQLGAVETSSICGMNLRAADVLRWVRVGTYPGRLGG